MFQFHRNHFLTSFSSDRCTPCGLRVCQCQSGCSSWKKVCLMLQPAPNHHSWNGPSVGHLSGAGPQPPALAPFTWKPQGPLALLLWVWILRTASDMLVLVSAWVKKSKEGKAAIIFLSEPNTLKMASAFSDLRRNR